MAKPIGWIVTGQHGWPWLDAHGRVLMLGNEDDATAFAESVHGDAGRVFAVARWKPSRKRPHEYGTDNKGER